VDALPDIPLVHTIEERCRTCFTCVRECPAKAIRVRGGQAQVIEERCIGCGNCVTVCSQKAKQVRRCLDNVRGQLASGAPVAAILAPSFPAEFPDLPPARLCGMLRKLGFAYVNEVGFGADLVAAAYRRLVEESEASGRRWISTTCPAIVGYVERYHPELVPSLAPVVSPMVAVARALRRLHGDGLRVVFVGPCIAKKRESRTRMVADEVNSAITFAELRELFLAADIEPYGVEPSEFDPPRGGAGNAFPLSGGMLESAGLDGGVAGNVVTASGRFLFKEAIEEFGRGTLDVNLLDVLACRGCIAGPGFTDPAPLFARRSRVVKYLKARAANLDREAWRADLDRFADLDLTRAFAPHPQPVAQPSDDELYQLLGRMGKFHPEDELNCGACGYETCREHAAAIHAGLAEPEMCLPHVIEELRHANGDLAVSNEQLANAQQALQHAEKLASMGQLAAGIAHEVNNPLGVVLLYAHLLLDECADPRQRDDLQLIANQADRCKKIVSGLLNFARQNKVVHEATDVRQLIDDTMLANPPPPGVAVEVRTDGDPIAEMDRDQICQVLTNLVTNAYAAMPQGGCLTVSSGGDAEKLVIAVEDTGTGISKTNMTKLFEPFFTTKPMGQGTGLGLPVTYGIVKMHRGDIRVSSNNDPAAGPTGTTFRVTLPRHGQRD
jgi:signal transduction histidine kinase/ferredoxin